MKTKLSFTLLLSLVFGLLSSQVPEGFNYQAIARDGSGEILAEKSMIVIIELRANSETGTLLWQESHSVISDQFGLISMVVGEGTRTGGLPLFTDIDWSEQTVFLKTTVEYPVGDPHIMGTTQIWAVPYSLVAKDVEGPVQKLGIEGTTANDEEALFEVKNNTGQTVFAVYNEGVRIYVNDIDAKGAKGGFAIGGFGMTKTIPHQYMFISGDSVRFNIDNGDVDKGPKGGFAIGGFGAVKGLTQKYFTVSNDSVRIYVDNADNDKGPKGGFAIGGYGTSKGKPQKLLTVSNDSVRIYINDGAKGPKGGFAIGGFDQAKGDGSNVNFFNVSTDANDTIDPSEPRILWYPLKNAFLTGQVLIELSDSVGVNSTATGYESKAVGDWSQAMGYMAIARGDYSTAIGDSSIAQKDNSFAFGDRAKSLGLNSFSFGKGATAKGNGSYALGSQGINDEGVPTRFTIANGANSFAIGMGAQTNERLAIAIGTDCTASGIRSIAIGSGSEATGFGSVALGTGAYAYGNYAVATNFYAFAHESNSLALGAYSHAYGRHSVAATYGTTAQAYNSFVLGRYNIISGNTTTWVATDPLFVIGNGSSPSAGANALTVLKNGNVAIGHDTPTQQLDLSGQIRIRGGSPAAGKILTSDAEGVATWDNIGVHTHDAANIISGTLPVIYGGTSRSTFTANKVLVGNGTNALMMPTYLHWDNTNRMLGIGNSAPAYSIDVTGDAQIEESAWLATSSGSVGIGVTSTSYKLDVAGTAQVTGASYLATSSGSVGIGNTSPSYKLDITGGVRSTTSSYLATSSGYVGIGTTSPGTHKLSVLSSVIGSTGSAGYFENTNGLGIALVARTYSTDGTALFIQDYPTSAAGYSLRCDGYDPDWFVAFTVKGRNVGIGTGSPGQRLDIIGGNGRVESGYSWLTNSDARYKTNITEIGESLLKVMSLRGVRFDMAEDESVIPDQGKHIGFIAQELETVLPELVVTGEDGYKSVAYDKIGPVLVEAIKEQQKQIESQQQQIDLLIRMIGEMKEQIASSR